MNKYFGINNTDVFLEWYYKLESLRRITHHETRWLQCAKNRHPLCNLAWKWSLTDALLPKKSPTHPLLQFRVCCFPLHNYAIWNTIMGVLQSQARGRSQRLQLSQTISLFSFYLDSILSLKLRPGQSSLTLCPSVAANHVSWQLDIIAITANYRSWHHTWHSLWKMLNLIIKLTSTPRLLTAPESTAFYIITLSHAF